MVSLTRTMIEPKAAVVGVGGAGCNVIRELEKTNYPMDTIAINTDKKSLEDIKASKKLYIGNETLQNKGTKIDVSLGMDCAESHEDDIREAISGYNTLFIVAGLGGMTGTGATPKIIEIAHSMKIMTFTIAIKPFFFEGERANIAKEGYNAIKGICKNSIAIENDLIVDRMGELTLDKAFMEINMMVMDYIDGCMVKCVKPDNDGGFDFMRKSPLFAFTNA